MAMTTSTVLLVAISTLILNSLVDGSVWNPRVPGPMELSPTIISNHFRRVSDGRTRGRLSRLINWGGQDVSTVKFYLFPNPQDREEKQEIILNDISSLSPLKWDSAAPTKFIVHGFIQNLNSTFPQNVKNAYLKRMRESGERINLIVVDWGKMAYELDAGLPDYDQAAKNTVAVGQRLGQLIKFLVDNNLIKNVETDLHLIGQSLGAHVTGNAGYYIQQNMQQTVARISGLDPAGPLFYTGLIKTRRLRTSDAKFVDVYHCNPGSLGIEESLGHVEFYPNCEMLSNVQPQCLQPRPWEPEEINLCSHNYCPKFFAYALLNKVVAIKCEKRSILLGAIKCDNSQTALYGQDVDLSTRGRYFAEIRQNLDSMAIFI